MKYFQITLLSLALLLSSTAAFSAERDEPEDAGKMPPPNYELEVLRGQPENREGAEAFHEKMKAHRIATVQKKQEICEMVKQLKNIEDPERKKVMNRIIRNLVAESFDLTSQRREEAIKAGEKRLEAATKKLEEAKLSLQRRKENKEKHIDSFMEKLLSEDPDKILGLKKRAPEEVNEKNPKELE